MQMNNHSLIRILYGQSVMSIQIFLESFVIYVILQDCGYCSLGLQWRWLIMEFH